MTNGDALKWLKNLKQDIGKPQHSELWHYEQALSETEKLLKEQQPKKGHWEMKFRHHKSVKHVKGYDAYDVEREIELVEESEGYEPYCSECGAAAAESFLCFCPKCGADMRESLNTGGEHE